VRLMSPADLCDALDEILLSSDDADIVIQRLAPVPGVKPRFHSIAWTRLAKRYILVAERSILPDTF
jgi:hypothetical protein